MSTKVYNTRSWVNVRKAVTHGPPARKKRGLKPDQWQHWKFATLLLNGRTVWDDVFGKDEQDALESFRLLNPDAKIDQAVFIGIIGK